MTPTSSNNVFLNAYENYVLKPLEIKAHKWLDENEITRYTSSHDEVLPNKAIDLLLAGKFQELGEYLDETAFTYDLFSTAYDEWHRNEYANHLGFDSFIDLCDDLTETYHCNVIVDVNTYWEECARNTKVNMLFTPLNPDNNNLPYEIPSVLYIKEPDDEVVNIFKDKFGIENIYNDSCTYEETYLRITGRIDILDIFKSKKLPTHIKIRPEDSRNKIGHNPGCGSTCEENEVFTKETIHPVLIERDELYKYGVDNICGMTGEYWRHEPELITAVQVYEPWQINSYGALKESVFKEQNSQVFCQV